jgi:hypothetical protein
MRSYWQMIFLAVSVAVEIGSKRLLATRVILSGNNLNVLVTTVEAGKTRISMYHVILMLSLLFLLAFLRFQPRLF